MNEQEPRPLEELHKEHNRINRALEKVDTVSQTIGTPAFERPELDLSRLQGEPLLDAAVRVGRIKQALEKRAKPTLLFQKRKTEEEIENNPRVQKVIEHVGEIRRLVQGNFLPGSVLEEAERIMVGFRQGSADTGIPEKPAYLRLFQRGKVKEPPKAAEEERQSALPDGQIIGNLTPHEARILAKLLSSSKENPIASSKIVQFLYGDKVSMNVGRNRLSAHLPLIRRKLAEVGWKVDREFRRIVDASRAEAWYYLVKEEAQDVVEEKPVVKVKQGEAQEKPTRRSQAAEVLLPNGKTLSGLGEIEKKLLEGLLYASKEKPASTPELTEFIYGRTVPEDLGANRISNLKRMVNKKLDSVGWEIVNLVPATDRFKRRKALYYLSQKESTREKEKTAQKRNLEEFRVILPDGQVIKLKSRLQAQALEQLIQTSEDKQIATDELAKILYAGDSKQQLVSTYSVLLGLHKHLERANWRLVKTGYTGAEKKRGQHNKYYLKKIVEEQVPTTAEPAEIPSAKEPETTITTITPTVEPAFPQEPKPIEAPSPNPVEVRIPWEEVTIIPYTPTKEERRSQEETRILGVIVSSLLSETRMRFEQIQTRLFSGDRAKPLVGGEAILIYQAEELIAGFSSAFRKIREEAAIGVLKDNWVEEEEKLWEKVNLLKLKLQASDDRNFLRRISKEIRRSESQFYRDYPPERGHTVTWIRKDSNR